MTREEAKAILKGFMENPLFSDIPKVCRAFDMAIKALEQELCEDCVSRKEVIDIINFEDEWLFDAKSHNADTKIAFSSLKPKVKALPPVTPTQKWIPVSERLPEENEYIGNVCKYYLVQDEYGDMHVAHLSNVGWIPMDSLRAIGNEIIAWQELPQVYVPEINVGKMVESEDKE